MVRIKRKSSLLASVCVMLAAIICAYAVQTQSTSQIKGVTFTSRVYEVKADGTIVEKGTMTSYISSQGSWRTVKVTPKGAVEEEVIADVARNGQFIVEAGKRKAARISSYKGRRTPVLTVEGYRSHHQFVREEMVLGFRGFVQRYTSPTGVVETESTFIPEFDILPFKRVQYRDDGSKVVYEPISIKIEEPAERHLRLPADVTTYDAMLSPSPQ